jgi:hypothetical protein
VTKPPGRTKPPVRTEPPARPASPIATAPLPVLIGGAVGGVALGFLVGAGGSFFQAHTVRLGIRWPVGALFSLLVLGALAFSAALLARSRIGLGMVTAGWLLGVFVFTYGRPEGDVIIAADLPGYLYLFGGVIVLAALATLPYSAIPAASSE